MLTEVCPHCKGDGCDPCDPATLMPRDCPACGGACRVAPGLGALYDTGVSENWTWEKWRAAGKDGHPR